MANYTDYANLTLDMINSLAEDSCLLANHFFHNEFTRSQFDSVREERINRAFVKMRTHSLDTLIKYGVIVKTRTEIYHVYVKCDCWDNTILRDMTDELWAMLPQSIRDELDVRREERKRCYYRVNYDKGEELVDIRNLLNTMFD